ncbi:hypothetical protein QR97_02505 [Streptomyces sp. PBH53]|uniref:hypothetical protein n=1 Tax=Streptomyces TaxID=1883 RepID=UPI00065548E0|nr:hypothetical protein [Streptomyces sp. PBH53]AKN68828.1 hypothetical protein QR97_02505 [Streptomyces sp. PBH53]
MEHTVEGVEREAARVSGRPRRDSQTPVLAFVEVVPDGDPGEYARRLRDVLVAVFRLAVEADFDMDQVPVETVPGWFVQVCQGGAATDSFAVDGRARYSERTGDGPWEIQDWLSRFDPELEARGWAFWDLTHSTMGEGQLNVWLDTWGEPFFSWEELRWLLYTCGADSVADPVVTEADAWEQERSA